MTETPTVDQSRDSFEALLTRSLGGLPELCQPLVRQCSYLYWSWQLRLDGLTPSEAYRQLLNLIDPFFEGARRGLNRYDAHMVETFREGAINAVMATAGYGLPRDLDLRV